MIVVEPNRTFCVTGASFIKDGRVSITPLMVEDKKLVFEKEIPPGTFPFVVSSINRFTKTLSMLSDTQFSSEGISYKDTTI